MASEVEASAVSSAQRKRALEALERRYAVSKREIAQPLGKDKKRAPNEEERDENRRKGGETASLATPKSDTPSKKGQFKFHSHTARHGSARVSDDGAHPAYCELSQNVHEDLVKPHLQHSSAGITIVNNVIHNLLQNGDSAQKYMQGSRSMKINDQLLLDNFVPGNSSLQDARVKALQSHSKRSRKHMSMCQHRACGSFDFPQEYRKFELFKPWHEMWKEYLLKLIKESAKHQIAHILHTADLHGAILQVVECKAAGLTGVSGMMVRETAETFGIIMQNDKFRVVPKKGSVFLFKVDSLKITLFGDKLASRRIGRG